MEAWKPLKNRPRRRGQFQYHNYHITILMFPNKLLYHAVTRAFHMHVTQISVCVSIQPFNSQEVWKGET